MRINDPVTSSGARLKVQPMLLGLEPVSYSGFAKAHSSGATLNPPQDLIKKKKKKKEHSTKVNTPMLSSPSLQKPQPFMTDEFKA
jgi:hypothetical protein